MKYNNFLFVIALCASLHGNINAGFTFESEPTYWESYAPQFMQDMALSTPEYIADWIPRSVKDRIRPWSTRKKIVIAGIIIIGLAALYNRDAIIAFINTDRTLKMLPTENNQSLSDIKIETAQPAAPKQDKEFEDQVKEIMQEIGTAKINGGSLFRPKELAQEYKRLHPHADTDPAYQEAIKRLTERGDFNY